MISWATSGRLCLLLLLLLGAGGVGFLFAALAWYVCRGCGWLGRLSVSVRGLGGFSVSVRWLVSL